MISDRTCSTFYLNRSLSLLVFISLRQERVSQARQGLSGLEDASAAWASDAYPCLVHAISNLDTFSRSCGFDRKDAAINEPGVIANLTDVENKLERSKELNPSERNLVIVDVGLVPCLLRVLRALKMEDKTRVNTSKELQKRAKKVRHPLLNLEVARCVGCFEDVDESTISIRV